MDRRTFLETIGGLPVTARAGTKNYLVENYLFRDGRELARCYRLLREEFPCDAARGWYSSELTRHQVREPNRPPEGDANMKWERPDFVEIGMNAEIGGYQSDFGDGEPAGPQGPVVDTGSNGTPARAAQLS